MHTSSLLSSDKPGVFFLNVAVSIHQIAFYGEGKLTSEQVQWELCWGCTQELWSKPGTWATHTEGSKGALDLRTFLFSLHHKFLFLYWIRTINIHNSVSSHWTQIFPWPCILSCFITLHLFLAKPLKELSRHSVYYLNSQAFIPNILCPSEGH